jgi:hypothetical protein
MSRGVKGDRDVAEASFFTVRKALNIGRFSKALPKEVRTRGGTEIFVTPSPGVIAVRVRDERELDALRGINVETPCATLKAMR